MALRLRSLLIAISPVLVAAALVWERTGALDVTAVVLILGASVMMQVITNLQNDIGYTVRGGERGRTRTGLPRATALGLLTARQVRTAIALAIVLAMLLGLPLVAARGWPVLAMGLASIAAALAYMGGPRPIAYTPFGEFVVFVFFGLTAVAGADYALTGGGVPATTWLAAIAMGALAVAALVVNNHRDREHDRGVGRRTFPVVFGADASRALYTLSLLAPFVLVAALAWGIGSPWLLLPLLWLPVALRLLRDFLACPPGLAFNLILFRTFKLELAFAGLLATGAVLARVLE
ncbi:MAG: 1,4-dihydroxy-2-naphthoate octaprenyltransferase [Betaproteobacteria bacterium]|nr:1,4-dihydroxy-2-naphthoate octaprenyltransferase [Betaproteobacteria bacterium]